MLYTIERATRQKIELMELPSTEMLNNKRIDQFTQRITDAMTKEEHGFFYQLIEKYQHEHNVPAIEIAAALASLIQGDTPLLLSTQAVRTKPDDVQERENRKHSDHRNKERKPGKRHPNPGHRPLSEQRPDKPSFSDRTKPDNMQERENRKHSDHRNKERKPGKRYPDSVTRAVTGQHPDRPPVADRAKPDNIFEKEKTRHPDKRKKKDHKSDHGNAYTERRLVLDQKPEKPPSGLRPKSGMERFRLEIGKNHGIKPGNIVGVLTSEAGLETRHIDQITIHETYSTVDLPKGMPKEIFRELKRAQVSGQQLKISKLRN